MFELLTIPKEGLQRLYNIRLENSTFNRGSRQLVLVSGMGLALENAFKLQLWINFQGKNVLFRPREVKVYKMNSTTRLSEPRAGDVNTDFEEVCRFRFQDQLSLTSTSNVATGYSTTSDLSKMVSTKKEAFVDKLYSNFLKDNLWLSIFMTRSWSTALPVVVLVTTAITLIPSIFCTVVFERTIPYHLNHIKSTSHWNRSKLFKAR